LGFNVENVVCHFFLRTFGDINGDKNIQKLPEIKADGISENVSFRHTSLEVNLLIKLVKNTYSNEN
jgi:hypothetical protein